MNARRSCRLLVVSAACLFAAACGAGQSNPEIMIWTARYDLPDGRCFVTDGRLLLDASYLPQLTIPEKSLPPERAERLLARETDKEFTFADLKCDCPDGQCATARTHYQVGEIVLHWVYVDLLRSPPLRKPIHFRAKSPKDPVLLLDGAQVIGALMPQ